AVAVFVGVEVEQMRPVGHGNGVTVLVGLGVAVLVGVRVSVGVLVGVWVALGTAVFAETVCTRKSMLVAYVTSPLYSALTSWVPCVNAVVVQAATPEVRATVPETSGGTVQALIRTRPSRNLTVPVGVPVPPLTVAVKVTEPP